jgi:uroporphyrinogen III methyltransferase / synthase
MKTLKIGARGSALSVAQTKQSIAQIEEVFPELKCELVTFSTAGDTDKTTSLTAKNIPDNFFSDTLDKAVLSGEIDAAVHSAKDLPDYSTKEIEWFYLPWREDQRDCIIFRKDNVIPTNPKIGISSRNRDKYVKEKWPDGKHIAIRGDIENRIAQLDRGEVDILILAVAGLNRLGLGDRISEIISCEELPTHIDQGKIAVTFNPSNNDLMMIRMMLLETIHICGAGTGRDGNYTHATSEALSHADLCLRDTLMNDEVLDHCHGSIKSVGKRYHDNASDIQTSIHEKMLHAICAGEKVVRLKGGDPALFGRLTEELEFLNKNKLPWKVHPGIPWFCSATLKHGIMITSRKDIRQFTVSTGTQADGTTIDCEDLATPLNGSMYFYMATRKIETICQKLIKQGLSKHTPTAIFREDGGEGNIVRGNLENIQDKFEKSTMNAPAIFLVGSAAEQKNSYLPTYGPLNGLRILSCGSPLTQKRLNAEISKLGGQPISLPLFKLQKRKAIWLDELSNTDWIILSSASAASFFIESLKIHKVDIRDCPCIATTGPSASRELLKYGLHSDYEAKEYSSRSLAQELIEAKLLKDSNVLILNSSLSQSPLSELLTPHCKILNKFHLYDNLELPLYEECPDFDIVTFCSPSAFNVFNKHYSHHLKNKKVGSIGPVTTAAIKEKGYKVDIEPKVYDTIHLIRSIASRVLWST